jgi:hypothetical protein
VVDSTTFIEQLMSAHDKHCNHAFSLLLRAQSSFFLALRAVV